MAHARLSPSASSIWMKCAGMPYLTQDLPDTPSVYAERGTAAHELLEHAISGKIDKLPEKTWLASNRVMLNAEDIEAVKVAHDYLVDQCEIEDEVETEVRLKYNDDLWGTADFVRYRPSTGELLVADYKHGSGVAVEANRNPQGMIYALMKGKALGNRGITSVKFVIIQPRCWHQDGPIREFVTDAADMLDWGADIQDALKAFAAAGLDHQTLAPNDLGIWAGVWLKAGDHCRWCKAAAICPALKNQAIEAAKADFSDGKYTSQELAEALDKVAMVQAWAKAVHEFAYAEAERGITIPGWKLVDKRPTQKWKDETNPTFFIADELDIDENTLMTEPELRSPAQVRDIIADHMDGKTKKDRQAAAKKFLEPFIDAVSSGRTLVREDDGRKPSKAGAQTDFDRLD